MREARAFSMVDSISMWAGRGTWVEGVEIGSLESPRAHPRRWVFPYLRRHLLACETPRRLLLPTSRNPLNTISALPCLHACADLTWHGLARSARESNPWTARASLILRRYITESSVRRRRRRRVSRKTQQSCRARDWGRARRTSSVPASLHSWGWG